MQPISHEDLARLLLVVTGACQHLAAPPNLLLVSHKGCAPAPQVPGEPHARQHHTCDDDHECDRHDDQLSQQHNGAEGCQQPEACGHLQADVSNTFGVG